MTKTTKNITVSLVLLILISATAFIGCSSEDSSITDPNGQLRDNNFGTNGFSFGDDPIKTEDGGSIDDGNILPANDDQEHDQFDTLVVIDTLNGGIK